MTCLPLSAKACSRHPFIASPIFGSIVPGLGSEFVLLLRSVGVTEARERMSKILPQIMGLNVTEARNGCRMYQTVLNKVSPTQDARQ